MILVTIELISARDGHRELLGKGTISNDGVGMNPHHTLGDYDYTWYVRGNSKRVWKRGKITGFPRKKLLAYDLLFRCLEDAVGERNRA